MESAYDIATHEVLVCDESFLAALLAADYEQLGTLLADDFLIIDVLGGQVAGREELLDAISAGQLRCGSLRRPGMPKSVRSAFVARLRW